MWHMGVCVCVCVHTQVTQLGPTLCGPMNYSPPGSSAHGIFQARIREWGAISYSKGSNLHLLHLPNWQADSLPLAARGQGTILN